MAAYALVSATSVSLLQGLFFSGWLGDRINPKYVVAAGMFGSAITVFSLLPVIPSQLSLFGAVPKMTLFYSVPYYVVTYVLFGLFQACGWPNEISIMVSSLLRSPFSLPGSVRPTADW